MFRKATSVLLTGVMLSQAACGAAKRPLPLNPAPTVDAHQQVEVWRAGRSVTLYGVRFASDTLSGVPYPQALDCANCRLAYPVSQVDSARMVQGERSAIAGMLGIPIGIALAIMLGQKLN